MVKSIHVMRRETLNGDDETANCYAFTNIKFVSKRAGELISSHTRVRKKKKIFSLFSLVFSLQALTQSGRKWVVHGVILDAYMINTIAMRIKRARDYGKTWCDHDSKFYSLRWPHILKEIEEKKTHLDEKKCNHLIKRL